MEEIKKLYNWHTNKAFYVLETDSIKISSDNEESLRVKGNVKIKGTRKNSDIDKMEYLLTYKDGTEEKEVWVNEIIVKAFVDIHRITIDNVILNPDGHFIEKQMQYDDSSKQYVNNIINRAKVTGSKVEVLKSECGNDVVIVLSNNINGFNVVYIPDNVEVLGESNELIDRIHAIHGKLKVIGGKSILSCSNLFERCKLDVLDLTKFSTSRVEDMHEMFTCAQIRNLGLGDIDTSNVHDMSGMFMLFKTDILDLSMFNTSKVTSMSNMFRGAEIKSLNLKNFDTHNVTRMGYMFNSFNCDSNIDLTSFNTEKVHDMMCMFERCECNEINLSSFKLRTDVMDISIFEQTKAYIIANDEKLKQAIKN